MSTVYTPEHEAQLQRIRRNRALRSSAKSSDKTEVNESSPAALDGLSALKKVSYNTSPGSWYQPKVKSKQSETVKRTLKISEEKIPNKKENSVNRKIVDNDVTFSERAGRSETSGRHHDRVLQEDKHQSPKRSTHRFKYEVGLMWKGGDRPDQQSSIQSRQPFPSFSGKF